MLGERLLERVEIGPGRRVGHADDLDLMGAQQGLEIEIAGIVHQHGVAGLEQEAADEVDRLRAGIRQHDLVGRGLDALLGHAPRQEAGAAAASPSGVP